MKKLILFIFLSTFSVINTLSQEVLMFEPLFEYPVAPDNIESLDEKCEYLVKHFWDGFDFKSKQPLNQYSLNDAFEVYVSAMRFAPKKAVEQSVEKLISKVNGNPTYLIQFTQAADETLYGPRGYWIDEIYLMFTDALIKNKKIPENRKTKYIERSKALRASYEGQPAPPFDFYDKNGDQKSYFPMSTPTILIFGDPDDNDWRIAKLKFDSNFKLKDALDKGKVNILYISSKETPDWMKNVSNYDNRWTVGVSSQLGDKYDTRLNPSIYIVNPEGKIIKKFALADEAVAEVLEMTTLNP